MKVIIKLKNSKLICLYINISYSNLFPNESISSIFTRITIITNSLDALSRTYTNVDIMSKILRSLLKTWEAKVMKIREAKNLTKLSLEKLIGLLMTHEIIMEKQELEEMPIRIWHSKPYIMLIVMMMMIKKEVEEDFALIIDNSKTS